jgi:hypothetical protein
MAAIITLANLNLSLVSPLRLVCDVLLGAATYGATLLSLWVLSGCPNAPEKDFIAFLQSRWPFPGNSARSLPPEADAAAMEAVATRTGAAAGE